jgi:hypothetical protein
MRVIDLSAPIRGRIFGASTDARGVPTMRLAFRRPSPAIIAKSTSSRQRGDCRHFLTSIQSASRFRELMECAWPPKP